LDASNHFLKHMNHFRRRMNHFLQHMNHFRDAMSHFQQVMFLLPFAGIHNTQKNAREPCSQTLIYWFARYNDVLIEELRGGGGSEARRLLRHPPV
jgi:hypothetical protein